LFRYGSVKAILKSVNVFGKGGRIDIYLFCGVLSFQFFFVLCVVTTKGALQMGRVKVLAGMLLAIFSLSLFFLNNKIPQTAG
jgi:hypothetical protein